MIGNMMRGVAVLAIVAGAALLVANAPSTAQNPDAPRECRVNAIETFGGTMKLALKCGRGDNVASDPAVIASYFRNPGNLQCRGSGFKVACEPRP